MVWMNPVITSKGASAVSSSSLSDWGTKFLIFLKKNKKTLEDLLVYLTDNLIWRIFSNTHALHIPMYPVEPVQETQCLDKGLDWVDPD